ncbi:MAG TPA: DUF1592 domain-containing protein, partial [Myxococcota bacterium]
MRAPTPFVAILAASLAGLTACSLTACTFGVPIDLRHGQHGGNASLASGIPTAPIRRLTQEELNHSLRDLFTGIDIPVVAINDADPGNTRIAFEGDAARQTPSDLVVGQLSSGMVPVAAAAVQNLSLLLPGAALDSVDDQRSAGHAFIASFLLRALRRPPEQRELDAYTALFDSNLTAHDLDVALEVFLAAALQSPSFVYRIEIGDASAAAPDGQRPVTSYEMASRLSYLLWNTMPDDVLLAAAGNDSLRTDDEIDAQARRMLGDQRAHDAVISFARQWLDLNRVLVANKDAATFPQWNDELRQAMKTETDHLVEDVVFNGGDAKLKTLLTTTKTRVNAELAAVYGIPAPAHDWDQVDLPSSQRAGLVTNAAFLSSRAHQVFGSPVLRGVFVLDRFLCEAPPPPPPNVNTNPPDPGSQPAATTNRERFAQHATGTCKGCHDTIDGIGFGLEGYDAIGQFRTVDNG